MKRGFETILNVVLVGFGLFSLSAFGEGQTVSVTNPGTFTPAQPPKQDRAAQSHVAAAYAKASGANSKVMCMMMMKEAMEQEDQNSKMAMMMMASQACNQGDQMAQSAQQNDQSAQQLGLDDIPKAAKFTAGSVSVQNGGKENYLSMDDSNPKGANYDQDGDVSMPPAYMPPSASPTPTAALPAVAPQAAMGTHPLSAIKATSVGFNDGAKQGANYAPQSASMPFGMGLGAQAQAGSSGGQGSKDDDKSDKRREPASDSASGGGGSDADEKSGGGDEALSALMNQLMGSPEAGAEIAALGDDTQLIESSGAPSNAQRANVFEYASIRYQKLHVDLKRLGTVAAASAVPVTTLAGH